MTFYLLGAGVLVLRLVAGRLAVRRLRRSARVADDAWAATLSRVKTGGTRVVLLECPDLPVPATCGVLRPVILVPAGSGGWPEDRRRMVLLHELGHVRRRDGLSQLIAQVACAVYWFNPLVWLLDRSNSLDRERACDDAVLRSEPALAPAEYAQTLVQVAQHLQRVLLPQGVIPMARTSQLQPRVTSILDRSQNRNGLTRGSILVAAVAAGLSTGWLAALQAGEAPAVGKEPLSPFQAELPSGMRVTLVGIGDAKNGGQGWWKPDGTKLDEQPYNPAALAKFVPSPSPLYSSRVFAAGLTDVPGEAADVQLFWSTGNLKNVDIPKEKLPAGFSLGTNLGISGVGQQVGFGGLWAGGLSVPATNDTMELRLQIGAGDWRDVESVGIDLPADIPEGAVSSESDEIAVSFKMAREGMGVSVIAMHDLAAKHQQARVVVIDKDNRRHLPDSTTVSSQGIRNIQQVESRFANIAPDKIKRLVLQGRAWQVVKFRNVSLRQGVKTDVQAIGANQAGDAKLPESIPITRAYWPVTLVGAVPHKIDFALGVSDFQPGDKIEITEVRGTKPRLEKGGSYLIKGRYTLASQDQAMLSAFVTTTRPGEGRSLTLPGQQIKIQRGSGEFSLMKTIGTSEGWPHVSFYPADGGSSFGGIYFGQEGTTHTPMKVRFGAIHDKASEPKGAARIETLPIEQQPPVVVSTTPKAGDTGVDAATTEIRVTYSKRMMDKSWSWSTDTGLGEFPEIAGEIKYLQDGRTCVMPVKLKPGTTYAIRLNSSKFHNFKDAENRPAVPYLLTFKTKE